VTFDEVKMESQMPELGGKMVVVRTTREVATRPPGKVPDLAEVQSIPLDRVIPNVHGSAGVTYKVTLTAGEQSVERVFPSDGRQTVANVNAAARTLDLTVTNSPPDPAPAPGPELLGTSFFVDWDDPTVKRYAATAISGLPASASALDKAKAVEGWVSRNMRAAEFSQAQATCANVARTLSGDCTEYAMLAVGMCRAVGVPARTALGLVYAPGRGGKPSLAYHMWFEVYADGRWVGLDATLGNGGIGPGHLKVTDASWDKEKSFAPLLPVLGLLGARPRVEVSQVRPR
jgi:transglutaminase-like putative cysteine protease